MIYPIQLTGLNNGLSLYVPDATSVKLAFESLVINNANTPFPFWTKIWASSTALCDFLKAHPNWVQEKNILEIGAGIGIPSFSIAKAAANVLITDHATDAVELMHKNINHLKLTNVNALCADWNTFPENVNAEVILFSDVNYAPEQFESLFKLMNRFLDAESTLIIATPPRIMGSPFIDKIQQFILHACKQTVMENGQATEISIYILRK